MEKTAKLGYFKDKPEELKTFKKRIEGLLKRLNE